MQKNKYLFIILFFSFILMPMVARATGELVLPCYATGNCGICDAIKFATNLAGYIIYISGAAALFFFLYAGLILIVSRGNATRIDKAQKIMLGTIVGLLLIYTAWVGVNFIIYSFADNQKQESVARIFNKPWQKFVCLKQETGAIVWHDVPTNNKPGSDGGCGADSSTSCNGSCGGIKIDNIKSIQCSDASKDLTKLLTCMNNKKDSISVTIDKIEYNLLNKDLIITSISDDNGLVYCRNSYSTQCSSTNTSNCCWHTRDSCHYGGPSKNIDGSYAADFRSINTNSRQNYDSNEQVVFKQLVHTCGGQFYWEVDHFHVSVPTCGGL